MGRRVLTQRQARLLDVALVVLSAAVGVARELLFPASPLRLLEPPVWSCAVVQVVGGLTLLWRRRAPAAAAAANSVLNLVSPTQSSLVAAWSLGAHGGPTPRSLAAFLALVGSWVLGAQLWNLADPVSGPTLLALLVTLGLYVAARRSLLDALTERAERAEREEGLLAARAVADERLRIARDMHDTIATTISMMVLQAGAIGVSTTDERVTRATADLRATGIRALDDLRELVEVLRSEPAPPPPAVLLAPAIEPFVRAARTVGLRVDVQAEPLQPVTGAVAHAVERVVQEALTNAAKHSPGAVVEVRVTQRDGRTATTVTSSPAGGRRPDPAAAVLGCGTGLLGLRERVQLLDGSFTADARDGGEFVVHADLPDDPLPRGAR